LYEFITLLQLFDVARRETTDRLQEVVAQSSTTRPGDGNQLRKTKKALLEQGLLPAGRSGQ
jgi:hypothetical protein